MKEADGAMTAIGFSRDPRRIGDLCFAKLPLRFSAEDRVFQTKEFAQRPGLEWTTARSMWSLGVCDLRDVAQAGFIEMFVEGRKESIPGILYRGLRVAANT